MTTQQTLTVGDVFAVTEGMKVQVEVPKMFVFANRPKDTDLCNHTISVGEVLDNDAPSRSKKFKTNVFKGEYVVVETRFDGGGRSGNDTYADGHHVIAQKLGKDGAYDAEGIVIKFYQSGSFNCFVPFEKTPILRTLKKIVTFV